MHLLTGSADTLAQCGHSARSAAQELHMHAPAPRGGCLAFKALANHCHSPTACCINTDIPSLSAPWAPAWPL
eukprot:365145-Chlamydomonas_euryale.AAC.20